MEETAEHDGAAAEALAESADEEVDHRMLPSIGRTVHYQLTKSDALRINGLVGQSAQDGERHLFRDEVVPGGFTTKKAHHGNHVSEGQILPLLIVCVWGEEHDSSVNGQLFVDGDFTLWLTSVSQTSHKDNAPEFGRWHQPPRV